MGTQDGLSSSAVQCIYQDRQGFMWFGTRGGLNKYDGYNFSILRRSSNNNILSSNDIKAVLQDNQQRLWIATADGGVNALDLQTEKFLYAKNLLPPGRTMSQNMQQLYRDKKGNIWVGSSDSGLYVLNSSTKFFQHYNLNSAISAITEDYQGNIWVGTTQAGVAVISPNGQILQRYNKQSNTPNNLSDDRIKFVFEDSKKRLWIGTYGGGLNQFDPDSRRFRQVAYENRQENTATHNFLLCIEEGLAGNLWIGTENGGLSIYNPNTGTATSYRHIDDDNSSIGSNTINCIKRDAKGNMWVGTANAGISMVSIDEARFAHYKFEHRNNSLNNNIVNTIFEDSDHHIWIGTDGGGLNLFNPVKGSFRYFTHVPGKSGSICGNYVLSINEDAKKNLWLGTWGDGLTVFNYEKQTYRHFRNNPADTSSLSSNYAYTVFRDSRNRIWVGTYGGGLNLYDEKKNCFTRFINQQNNAKSISSNYILTLQEDRQGNLWIGTDGGGLNKFNEVEKNFTTYTTASKFRPGSDHFSNNSITSIWEDKNGRLWLGTNFGLNRFEPQNNHNTAFFSEDGLPNDAIGAVLGDAAGMVWISTNKGLSKFNPATKRFRNYSTADGLQADEFKYAKCLDHRGFLYFGGRNGFNVFNPDKIKAIRYDPPLVFTNFQLFNKDVKVAVNNQDKSPLKITVSQAKKIVLSYQHSSFSFEFAALNYTANEKKQYAYKLEGYDDQWHYLENKNSLTYTNLDPGSYLLKVKGRDNDQKWSGKTACIALIITPPFWKTWWFKTLLLFFVAGTTITVFYLRLSSIKNSNKLLEKEVRLRTQQLSENNIFLKEKNEKIKQQKKNLQKVNKEIINKTNKILQQQEQILFQNQQLETTVQELEASNQTKDRFFSILAHDLKNPITALSGLADLLKARLPHLNHHEIASYVQDISKSSDSVHNLVINLLDWARTQSKNLQYQPVAISLHELVMKNVYLSQIQLTHKNLSCQVAISSTHIIYADYQMIHTVIRNMLSNSIKFTPVSGNIILRSEETEHQIAIIIEDTGMGMSAQQIEQLQKPNAPVSVGTAGETGTGLGLQICRDFIKVNKGTLDIESKPGHGSVFSIRLPKAVPAPHFAEAQDLPEEMTLLSAQANHNTFISDGPERTLPAALWRVLQSKRILIVDDNSEIRSYLKVLLSGISEIKEAENGQEAIEIAITDQPDLIITDLIMPVMNGLEFCKVIKSNLVTSHIPVLLLTGETTSESQVLGYEAGADIYLTKPVNQPILIRVIYNFIVSQDKIKRKFAVAEQLIPEDLDYNQLDKDFLAKMTRYVEENIAQPDLDFKKLGEHASMSRTVLYAKFKTLTDLGVHDFIKNIRLKKALQLLQEGKLNISQVAYEVGFATPSYFSKSFMKQYNLTPKEYVLLLKQNAADKKALANLV